MSSIFVAFAAVLWATDALVRFPTIAKVDPTFVVFIEHLLAVLILLPWLLFKSKTPLFSLGIKEWLAAFFSGAGGSAIATVFFTASFLYVNPSVAVLLQKLQPIMVVLIAYFLLGERPKKKFFFWGGIALIAGIILSFPDLNFKFISQGVNLHSKGIKYAFGAAFFWAAATVSGKILLKKTDATLATFWRFFFGLLTLLVLLALSGPFPSWSALNPQTTLFPLLYLSLIPGLLAILIYYKGLSKTSATVTTIIELIYPIAAVMLNTLILHTPLFPIQTIAGVILILAVAIISF